MQQRNRPHKSHPEHGGGLWATFSDSTLFFFLGNKWVNGRFKDGVAGVGRRPGSQEPGQEAFSRLHGYHQG